MVKKSIAIIPARGGSKRIPKKNIINFNGKPMIAWTIISAIESYCFDRVLVSTDSEEIVEISKSYGAEVPFMRDGLSDDITPTSTVTISALNQASSFWKEEYNTVFQLMPNCPLRDKNVVKKFVGEFDRENHDFLISCFKFGWMNPWWALKKENDKHSFLFPEAEGKRSQDLDDLWCPTGSIWAAKSAELIQAGTFYGPGVSYFEIDLSSAMDIDNFDDLKFASALSQVKI